MSRVLAIRTGRVGDMVMLTPALQAILELHPGAEVDLLTSRDGQRVFRDFSPRLLTLIYQRHGFFGGLARLALLRQVRLAEYDFAYCFETKASFAAFAHAARQGFVIGPESLQGNYARGYLDLVLRAHGQPARECWSRLPIGAEARARAAAQYAAAGIPPNAFVIGMHPGYSGLHRAWRRQHIDAGRRWPEAAFAALARGLVDEGAARGLDLRVVMDLLPEEAALGERIVRLSGGAVTLMTPPPDFQRYKAALERMDLLVTTDTGAMHVAGAVGTRLVALFGITEPIHTGAFVPPGDRIEICSATRVMADILPAEVFEACLRFLPDPAANSNAGAAAAV